MKYVLITPARNEERFITKTLDSVVAQTLLPARWIIVNDGSTDRTAEIVESYAKRYPWIELIHRSQRPDRNFAGKADAFNAGFERVRSVPFEVIGNLDADISFERDYLEFLVGKFFEFPGLGVAGTPMEEANYQALKDSFYNENDVFGACQLFRRACFEEVGGYTPIKWGGIDWVAVRTARLNGWQTRSFHEKLFYHHRQMGATESNTWKARFDYGRKDYFLGNHPLWQIFRVGFQMMKRPYLLGGLLLLSGYFYSFASRMERPVAPELLKFHRQEQLARLKDLLTRVLRTGQLRLQSKDMATSINDVRNFWNANPCQSWLSQEADRRRYFEDISRKRFQGREWHIPIIARFDSFRGKDVVEIGCGLGTDGIEFAKRGANYIGVDLTPKSVELTQERFQVFGVPGRFEVANAETGLPFPDASVDHVYSFGVIHHSPTPEKIVGEIYRILRPGGTFTVMLYNRNSINYYVEIMFLRRLFRWCLLPKFMPRLVSSATGFDLWKLEGHRDFLKKRVSKEEWISMNTDGPSCPLARVYNYSEAAALFGAFENVRQEVWEFNVEHWSFIGKAIPDSLAKWIGRHWGWHRVIYGNKPLSTVRGH